MTPTQLTRREESRQYLIRLQALKQASAVQKCLLAWSNASESAVGHPDAKKDTL